VFISATRRQHKVRNNKNKKARDEKKKQERNNKEEVKNQQKRTKCNTNTLLFQTLYVV
jgi:hypothetical protein